MKNSENCQSIVLRHNREKAGFIIS